MKRTLHVLLLLGALIGLFGQETAFAIGPSLAKPAVVAHSVSDMEGMDCAGMVTQPPEQDSSSKPCKGLTLDCIAQMGCVVPIFLNDGPAPARITPIAPIPSYWPSTPRLIGRSYGPEPEPPAVLS